MLSPVAAVAVSAGLPYLTEVIDPNVRAAGGVVAVPSAGVEALGSNPARIYDANQDGVQFLSVQVPETRVQMLSADLAGGLVATHRLVREGYSAGVARRVVRLSSSTRLGAEIGFRGSGMWTRVDHEGTARHAFPRTDWLVGVSVARRLERGISAGASAKWLRAKYTDIAEPAQFGHGWAFDVGLHYGLRRWRFGLVGRNLSGGLSSPDPERPRDPRHEVVLGVARAVPLSDDTSLDFAADVRFPSRRGAQTASGATLTFRDAAGVSLGYQRRVEKWQAQSVDLEQGTAAPDERLWVAQGPTFGGWVQLAGWVLSFGGSPLFLPAVAGTDRRALETSRWLWTAGIGRGH